MILDEDDYLAHYGTPRHSGRYPWGSGRDPQQTPSSRQLLDAIDSLKKQGLSEKEIMEGFGMNSTEYRAAKSIAKNAKKQADITMAQSLKDKGLSNVAIGERMGINESSVRALLAPGVKDRANVLQATANMLKEQIDEHGYIDVGQGVENHIGVSKSRLATAVALLKDEGYKLHYIKVLQLGTGKETTLKVMSKPGVPWKEVNQNKYNIQPPFPHSEDGGRTYGEKITAPTSVSSKRLAVRYAEHGGTEADGVIYIRPGVEELSLGASQYAQVRIAVDGSHFLKGMAVYKPDLPEGVDLLFNTNKSDTGNKLDALKPMKRDKDGTIDPDNPFGAVISRQHGVMNIVNEEGSWEPWSKTLSSQFLSKQSPTLIKTQLQRTVDVRKQQLQEILQLTNPAVRRTMLESFADDADAAAVHLKAAALPRQASHVILPVPSMKETEIYAPQYNNGERVVLVRHPHGGTFEIPELVVNNRQPDAQRMLGKGPTAARDAVGIHPKVAALLSGADFDGDTVLVIPNDSNRILTTPALEGLAHFDPKREYAGYEGMVRMTSHGTQRQMGDISNLITDMTIKGANNSEKARAVRHSMVVIDAERHGLNYKLSAERNGIAQLKKKYQGSPRGGAATLISRKKTQEQVPERKQGYRIDPETGKRIFIETGRTFPGRNGEIVVKKDWVSKLDNTDNAHTLSSGTRVESLYADHSNALKDIANQARKELVKTKSIPYSPSAAKVYKPQADRLKAALNVALKNAPLERRAQLVANAIVEQKKAAYPDMTPVELKKIRGQALATARQRVGAGKQRIDITDDEWEAIQAGAISDHMLTEILRHTDVERVRQLATPRHTPVVTSGKKEQARVMLDSGHTMAEVASHLGVSVSALRASLKESQ